MSLFKDESSELSNISIEESIKNSKEFSVSYPKPIYSFLEVLVLSKDSDKNTIKAGGKVPCVKKYIGEFYQGYLVTDCNCTSCFNFSKK